MEENSIYAKHYCFADLSPIGMHKSTDIPEAGNWS